jgi:hypothetical protein
LIVKLLAVNAPAEESAVGLVSDGFHVKGTAEAGLANTARVAARAAEASKEEIRILILRLERFSCHEICRRHANKNYSVISIRYLRKPPHGTVNL